MSQIDPDYFKALFISQKVLRKALRPKALIPFRFSTVQRYWLRYTDALMRVVG